jgi:outer membrane protein OmpA-like peptidoglycan-associated protein
MKMGKPLFLALSMALLTSALSAQSQETTPAPERYVIIGAFRILDNAVRFTERANNMNFHAGYIQNPRNKLYLVYIFQSTESRKALAFMMKVRLETEFKEAWVYIEGVGRTPQDNPVVDRTIQQQRQETVREIPKEEPKDPEVKEQPKDSIATQPIIETPKDPIVTEQPKKEPDATTMEPKPVGKPFFFKLISNETGEPLVGEIHVFEPNSNSQSYQVFPSNQVVYLPAPKDPSQVYAITTLSAGYQEMDRAINYADPAASQAEVGNGSEFVVSLPLVHVKMGDYIEFSNVRFFQNSVMLHPEAKEELDGLVELMKQNPRYKINVHAHCNGTQDRNIVVRGNGHEYFGASTGNQRKTVSAKQLTELRAQLVKDYLISQGVESKRIKSKGEGGAATIYPTNSILSNRNDRVEIEVKRGK